jgi:hypothetical protein
MATGASSPSRNSQPRAANGRRVAHCSRCTLRRARAATSSPEHAATAVLYLDLDRFELVKDCLGRDAADQLLDAVLERSRHTLGQHLLRVPPARAITLAIDERRTTALPQPVTSGFAPLCAMTQSAALTTNDAAPLAIATLVPSATCSTSCLASSTTAWRPASSTTHPRAFPAYALACTS